MVHFNPRPREEGDVKKVVTSFIKKHFNPRPREEGDGRENDNALLGEVSIHALVKRATPVLMFRFGTVEFQSTPS